MANEFYQDELEEFLQQQLKNQRMYPSDHVWRNISKNLHGDKKWPALTIAAFLMLFATIGVSVYFSPKPNIFESAALASNTSSIDNSSTTKAANNLNSKAPYFKTPKSSNQASVLSTHNDWDDLNTAEISGDDKSLVEQTLAMASPVNAELISISSASSLEQSKKPSLVVLKENSTAQVEFSNPVISSENINTSAGTTQNLLSAVPSKIEVDIIETTKSDKSEETVVKKADPNDKNVADKFLNEHKDDIALFTSSNKRSMKNKFSLQIYATPSASFRKLSEDPLLAYMNHVSGPVAVNYVADVNEIVRHTPGVGLEAGANIQYNVSEKFKVKTGVQFNVRQYKIEAYKGNTELTTIALIRNTFIDSVNTLAGYRTSSGYYSTELVNSYYQLSVPIGVEYQVFGNHYIQFNVAATLQPTYLLNSKAYLLSTNLKNYAENTDMVRRWNMNSSFEAFISFTSGDYKIQIGPQFRYQHLPTFIKAYPIKEHLMDYGVKVGFSRALR